MKEWMGDQMTTPTLTRAIILDTMVQEVNLPRQKASDLLEALFEEMVRALLKEGHLKISSFGSFNVHQKAKRVGRNPKTGEEAIITPRRVLSFKPSQYLREKAQRRK
jgi:integration host factor subunit alpha